MFSDQPLRTFDMFSEINGRVLQLQSASAGQTERKRSATMARSALDPTTHAQTRIVGRYIAHRGLAMKKCV
jgi:hypothetical protein